MEASLPSTPEIFLFEENILKNNKFMHEKILKWFVNGKVGESSKAMVSAATDQPMDGYRPHPSDPADFNRCLLLLDAVPEIRNAMNKIADISEVWKKLVARWDEVEHSFIREVGQDWCNAKNAPKTYKLMKEIGC